MTNPNEVLDAAMTALKRGDRGRRVDRASLGLPEGPLDRELVAAARERGLAIFPGMHATRLNVVSLAPPASDREMRLAVAMVKARSGNRRCAYCSLQEITPPKARSPLVPVDGKHRIHRECRPGWDAWAAAAETYLAARRPSNIPATAGLAAAVIRIAPALLRERRGVRERANVVWGLARDVGGPGAWATEGFGAAAFTNVLMDSEVRAELNDAGLLAWRGADGLVRLARVSDVPPSNETGAAWCSLCHLDELDGGEPLEQVRGGARVHSWCEFGRIAARRPARRAA